MATTSRKGRKEQTVDYEQLGAELGNKPPQALDIEEAVLGAILVEPNCVDETLGELTPGCFYSPQNREIFTAISELVNSHIQPDVLTVTQRLRAKKLLDEVGGAVYLAHLSEKVGAAAHVEYYVRLLKQKNIQRELITAACVILKSAYDDTIDVDALVDQAQTKVYDAIQNNVRKDVKEIGAILKEAMDDIEKAQTSEDGLFGVPTGFPTLDKITLGWQPSDLIILAARPSVGKTAFALNLARNAAVIAHKPVAFFSLEMSAVQLVKRLMTTETGLSAEKIKGGQKLEKYEWEQLEYQLKNLSHAPLYVDDTPGLPLMEFRSKLKRLVSQKGVKLVVVDYLQLMQGPLELRGMREQEVAAISRTLKQTAKELNIPIIALSQLSRQSVQRQGGSGKPQLSDLRESGSIEQDADMVLFIHRPEYVSGTGGDKETTQLIIAKNRNGEVRDIDMRFISKEVRFVEMDEHFSVPEERRYDSAMNTPQDYSPFPDDGGNPDFV